MPYRIVKPTQCAVANHVWIYTTGDSTASQTEPQPTQRCDCGCWQWMERDEMLRQEAPCGEPRQARALWRAP